VTDRPGVSGSRQRIRIGRGMRIPRLAFTRQFDVQESCPPKSTVSSNEWQTNGSGAAFSKQRKAAFTGP
jgi:hypothetical protein